MTAVPWEDVRGSEEAMAIPSQRVPSRGGAASEVRGWTGLGALVSPRGNVSGAESLKAGGNKDHLLQVK